MTTSGRVCGRQGGYDVKALRDRSFQLPPEDAEDRARRMLICIGYPLRNDLMASGGIEIRAAWADLVTTNTRMVLKLGGLRPAQSSAFIFCIGLWTFVTS